MGYEIVRTSSSVELRPALLANGGAREAARDVLRLRLCGTARHDEVVRVLLAIPDEGFEVEDRARVGDSLHGAGTVLVRAHFDVLVHTLARGEEFEARLDGDFVGMDVEGGEKEGEVRVAPARRGAWVVHVTSSGTGEGRAHEAARGDTVRVRCDETFVDGATGSAVAVGALVPR